MTFRMAVVQFAPVKGDVPANLDLIAAHTKTAVSEGAELCLFPESAACGYVLEGAAPESALAPETLLAGLSTRLRGLTKQVDLLVGFYEKADGQPYNSAAYMSLGPDGDRVVHVYRKFFLPTYGVFDEERFHQRGLSLGVYDTRFGRFGTLICEDVWHSVLATLCAVSGAQVMLVPSASPVRGLRTDKPGNVLRYERMLRAVSEEHGMYTAAAMLVGVEGGKAFSGGSMVFDPDGESIVQAPMGDEAMVIADIDLDRVTVARTRTPLIGDLRASWDAIVRLATSVP
ncbi:MAG: beta-ureidopropionase [Armatimonadetes bacterium]|nr:beta-ureidopropionase [Armatimonadota bacterium]